jgi:SAM-dependent methyltransferase
MKEKLKRLLSPHKRYIYKHLTSFVELIVNHSMKNSFVIVDIGSGESPYKILFEPLINKYVSIDISYSKNVEIIGRAQNLPLKSHAVDIVLLSEVLEHIYETEEVFKEINHVLRHNGYLILTTPLLIGYHDSIDYFRFTHTALETLLKEFGFEILTIKKRGGIFVSLAGILFSVPRSLLRSRGVGYYIFLALLTPLIISMSLLDRIDKKQNFTLGYEVLALKIEEVDRSLGLTGGVS